MRKPLIGFLHYTAPPIIGGVEAVILAHAREFNRSDFPVTLLAGRGDSSLLPAMTQLTVLPEMDSQHKDIVQMNASLEAGLIPAGFEDFTNRLTNTLRPHIQSLDHLIIHNVFTKHFNLPLTVALHNLINEGAIRHPIAWCHDITWTSPNSRSKVHPGFPWDLLRTYHKNVTYVVVSEQRQLELADLFGCDLDRIRVIYNGVDPLELLGLSGEGYALIERLRLLEAEIILLMPVRITKAKNIEYAMHLVAALKALQGKPMLILTGPPDPHDPNSMEYYRSLQVLRKQLGIEDVMRFVFESAPDLEREYYIDATVVGDLFRISDIVFIPSYREGFGMPLLEAGLAGVPVACTDFPAAREIGATDITRFSTETLPEKLADQILHLIESNPLSRLRRKVRLNYTWQALFHYQIEPLLENINHDLQHGE